jgi:hypothetical protein
MPSRGVFSPEEIAIITTAFEDTLRALGLVNRKDPAVTMVAKGGSLFLPPCGHGQDAPFNAGNGPPISRMLSIAISAASLAERRLSSTPAKRTRGQQREGSPEFGVRQ